MIRKLALAMQAAHDAGVVHRDLKPSNVIIDREGEPVVMDFGLAGRVDLSGDSRLTQSGTVLGTPAYMSPEQIEGKNDRIGPPSDIYSLGVVMYELLSGRLPFRGNPASVMAKALVAKPPNLKTLRPEVDDQLVEICEGMMRKRVASRTASMAEVAKQITQWLDPSPDRSTGVISEEPKSQVPMIPREQTSTVKTAAAPVIQTAAAQRRRPPRNPRTWQWIAAAGALPMVFLGILIAFKISIQDSEGTQKTIEAELQIGSTTETLPKSDASTASDGEAASEQPKAKAPTFTSQSISDLLGDEESDFVDPDPATARFSKALSIAEAKNWNDMGPFKHENGLLVADEPGYSVSLDAVRDFELEFEFRLDPETMAGIYYDVSPDITENPQTLQASPSYALCSRSGVADEMKTGSMHRVWAPKQLVEIKHSEFHHGKIIRTGNRTQHWLDGELVLDVDRSSEAFYEALEKTTSNYALARPLQNPNRICLHSESGRVTFRSIKLRYILREFSEGWVALNELTDSIWDFHDPANSARHLSNSSWWANRNGLGSTANGKNNWLQTKLRLQNFVLAGAVWFPDWSDAPGTSGVVIRSQGVTVDGLHPTGLEIDLRPNDKEMVKSGSLFTRGIPPISSAMKPSGPDTLIDVLSAHSIPVDQNPLQRFKIICLDDQVVVVINGQIVNRCDRVVQREGTIAIRNQNTLAVFSDLRVKPLASGLPNRTPVQTATPHVSDYRAGEWIDLFRGGSTEKWADLGPFQVDGDTLVQTERARGLAETAESFGDFELEFEWKFEHPGHTGIYYRAFPGHRRAIDAWESPEFALNHSSQATPLHQTGGLFAVMPPDREIKVSDRQFHRARVVCFGSRIEHWVDDIKVLECDVNSDEFKAHLSSFRRDPIADFGLKRSGPIYLLGFSGQVRYRNIRIRRLYSKPLHKLFATMDFTLPGVGEFRGHTYQVFDEVVSWKEAKQRCELLGGHLAIVESDAENEFIYSLLKTRFPAAGLRDAAWLGGSDEVMEGDWRWVDGTAMNYKAWRPPLREDGLDAQPNNGNNSEHYLMMYFGENAAHWCDQPNQSDDIQCRYVCEWDSVGSQKLRQEHSPQ